MDSICGVTGQVFYGPIEAMARPQGKAIQAYRQMIQRDLDRGPLYHAAQVISGPVIALEEDGAVASAWRTLRDSHLHQAPAIDHYYKLVGIVSERDLLTAIYIDGSRKIENFHQNVPDVMTTPVVAAAPITHIRRIATVMRDHGVDGVPIVNDAGGVVCRGGRQIWCRGPGRVALAYR